MPVSNNNRKKKAPKVVLTTEDRERLEAAFYRKAEEYMKLDLTTLRDMEKSFTTPDGFKITGVALQALAQVIANKQQLLRKTA